MIPRSMLRPGLRIRRRRRFQDDLLGTVVRFDEYRIIICWDDEDINRVVDLDGDVVPNLEIEPSITP